MIENSEEQTGYNSTQRYKNSTKRRRRRKANDLISQDYTPRTEYFLESERKIAVSFKRGIKKDTRVAFKRVYRLSLAFVVSRERAESCLVESHRGAVLVHVSLDWK